VTFEKFVGNTEISWKYRM